MIHETSIKIVESIIKKLGLKEPPIPIEKVADLFSIKVIPYKFPNNFSGVLREIKGQVIIGVNESHHPNRRRFTIAHELGHYLLGHNVNRDFGLTDDVLAIDKNLLETNKEKEANIFAAELLMPKFLLESDVKNFKGKIKIPELAKRYGVSEQVVSIRLLETGLIHDL